jgi:hypothetical protein
MNKFLRLSVMFLVCFATHASASTTIFEGQSFPGGLYIGMDRSALMQIADNGNCDGNVTECLFSAVNEDAYIHAELQGNKVFRLTTNARAWSTSAGATIDMSPAEVLALYPNATSETDFLREVKVDDSTLGYSYFFKRTCFYSVVCSTAARHVIYAVNEPTETDGNIIRNLSAGRLDALEFSVEVSQGSGLNVIMSGGTGDADLYVRKGARATTSIWDCRPYLEGNNESCNVSAGPGTYYITLRAFHPFSGVQLNIIK